MNTINIYKISILYFALTILFSAQLKANMSEPVLRGTLFSRPFVSQFVDISHEDIFIKIDKQFNTASFEITYHINALADGIKIPLLFYAADYETDFNISIDGVPVDLLEIPYDYRITDTTKFHDFSYFFDAKTDVEREKTRVFDGEDNSNGFYLELKGMKYFETNILKGEHTIKVTYTAIKWVDGWDWINKYSFRYALSPAKYWKSFGTLSVTIDASAFENTFTTNLGEPQQGDLASIAKWEFDSLPTETMKISFEPEINKTAVTLIKIRPERLAYIIGLILMILHIMAVRFYRINNPEKKFSWVVIVGSIIVPLMFFLTWIELYPFIDSIIGEHASKEHGYAGLQIILYPIVMPFYLLVIWLTDRIIKKRAAVI